MIRSTRSSLMGALASRRSTTAAPTSRWSTSPRLTTALTLACASAAIVAAPAAAVSASTGPGVSVKVQTPHKTLVNQSDVHGTHGWITKGGTPRGKCSGSSAAGALNTATHGHWTGKYYSSVPGIFITSILGYKPSHKRYWEVLVDGKASSKGICDIKLGRGERLLFKVTK